jgi:hypothetical protein
MKKALIILVALAALAVAAPALADNSRFHGVYILNMGVGNFGWTGEVVLVESYDACKAESDCIYIPREATAETWTYRGADGQEYLNSAVIQGNVLLYTRVNTSQVGSQAATTEVFRAHFNPAASYATITGFATTSGVVGEIGGFMYR